MTREQPDTTTRRPLADLSELASASADVVWRLARNLRQEWRRERYSRFKPD